MWLDGFNLDLIINIIDYACTCTTKKATWYVIGICYTCVGMAVWSCYEIEYKHFK